MNTIKVLAICLSFFVFTLMGSSSWAICLFGDFSFETYRMADLKYHSTRELTEEKVKDPKIIKQIIVGMDFSFGRVIETLSDAFGATDEGMIFVSDVIDTAHNNRVFKYYKYSAGNTSAGFFVHNKTDEVVALMGDQEISWCIVDFENYDSLPWFYTN